MIELIDSYLGYLRDCARLSSRESDIDMLRRSSSFKVLPLSSSQLRELKSRDGSFLSTDPELLRWRREARISDEAELMIYIGFPLIIGKTKGNKKIAAPLLIAPCELLGDEEHQVEVLIDTEALEVYTPVVTEIMERSSDTDEYTLLNDVESLVSAASNHPPGIPPLKDDMREIKGLLSQIIPENKKQRLDTLMDEIKGTDMQTIKEAQDDEWKIIPSLWLMRTIPLTDFTVAREIDQILKDKNGEPKSTSIGLIISISLLI